MRNRPVYVALGSTPNGTKDILRLWIEEIEGFKFWLRVMIELKNRGVADILIARIDGPNGFQDAIKAVFMDRVNIVSLYEQTIRSPSFEMALPSVVSLKTYIKPARIPAFTRFNLFLRDRFTCQYCGNPDDLTFDHVIPRSKGGQTTWDNVVAACSACNLKKSNHLPAEIKMWPQQKPFTPTSNDLQRNGRHFPPNHLHRSWLDYLYWDSELEP